MNLHSMNIISGMFIYLIFYEVSVLFTIRQLADADGISDSVADVALIWPGSKSTLQGQVALQVYCLSHLIINPQK